MLINIFVINLSRKLSWVFPNKKRCYKTVWILASEVKLLITRDYLLTCTFQVCSMQYVIQHLVVFLTLYRLLFTKRSRILKPVAERYIFVQVWFTFHWTPGTKGLTTHSLNTVLIWSWLVCVVSSSSKSYIKTLEQPPW